MKTLVYDSVLYYDFQIDEDGNIMNRKTGHIYKPTLNKQGYLIVTLPLGKYGVVKSIRVHKAVAETYIPNPDKCTTVHHLDGNKANPCVTNLKWVTAKENTHYSLVERSKSTPFFNNRKLKREDVSFIKEHKHEYSYSELAAMFGVSKTTIINAYLGHLYVDEYILG